jgi:predicted O-methyltransferase YrrM
MLARLKNFIFGDEETNGLNKLPKATLDETNLRKLSRSEVDLIMRATLPEWASVSAELARIHPIRDMKTGGVNPGDRRAVYHFMRSFRPASVLEIGTHVGASTLHIAAGLKQNGAGTLTTVDIKDVNAPDGYWKHFQLVRSPADAISEIGMTSRVKFKTMLSVTTLAEPSSYDFIFLDGDHAAATVYEELPLALRILRPNGVILLHDYFPDAKPLWNNNQVVPGPFLACSRMKREGAAFNIIPLGPLPWPTKLGSNVTSLAIVARQAGE